MKYFSHLNTALTIIRAYDGKEPFHLFIKEHFRQQTKYGSTDRKRIATLCYCYFRVAHALKGMDKDECVLCGLFLCSNEPDELLEATKPEWNKSITLKPEEKCKLMDEWLSNKIPIVSKLFPYTDQLSEAVDKNAFALSHLQQPDLFIRVRPGNENDVTEELNKADIPFKQLSENCIALANTVSMDKLLDIDRQVVIQDYSSQRVGAFLQTAGKALQKEKIKVWDCCAASGGKSILAKDILENIDLTVSDIRTSILTNLKKRFTHAGINEYKTFVLDVGSEQRPTVHHIYQPSYDLIIADVPCSGSGTWGRTPEQMLFFSDKEINSYRALQKKIVTNAVTALRSDGYFLYITCSVYKKENEEMVDFIKEKLQLTLVRTQLLKGYTKKADTMFAALFKLPA